MHFITDYEYIFERLQKGEQFACFVDYRFDSSDSTEEPTRDIAKAKMSKSKGIDIGCRGVGHVWLAPSLATKENFISECQKLNIHFFDIPKEKRIIKPYELRLNIGAVTKEELCFQLETIAQDIAEDKRDAIEFICGAGTKSNYGYSIQFTPKSIEDGK